MADRTTSVYYDIRLEYKRSKEGQVLEALGKHVEIATNLLIKCLAIGTKASRVSRYNEYHFESTEFSMKTDNATQFDTIRLCEMKWDSHICGILMVLRGTHKRDLRSLSKAKKTLRTIIQDMQESMLAGSGLKDQDSACHQGFVEEFQRYEQAYDCLDKMQRAILKPTIENPPILDCREYFALILLSQRWAKSLPDPLTTEKLSSSSNCAKMESSGKHYISQILKLFEQDILSRAPKDDHWASPDVNTGRHLFMHKLQYFTSRRIPVHFCLPAFPCKSTNPMKTSSRFPDGAEYEALANLHRFCKKVKAIYPPGAAITVVSDGHVFSDCVGVDDDRVFDYTDRLKLMSEDIYLKNELGESAGTNDNSPLSFTNLHDIFQPNALVERHFRDTYLEDSLLRALWTNIHPRDETCRKLMVKTCGIDPMILGSVIETRPDHPLTALYRGFARFMLDDLAALPDMQTKTKHQQKLLAQQVAKIMIGRNQAYSHLIELVMPRAIRLSIHAHHNYGPKFAVNLLPVSKFCFINSFKDVRVGIAKEGDAAGESLERHLHIPTPWHNVLVEVENQPSIYICKAGLVGAELKDPDSPFCPQKSVYTPNHPRYGRYMLFLRYKDGIVSPPSPEEASIDKDAVPENIKKVIYTEIGSTDGAWDTATVEKLAALRVWDNLPFREQIQNLEKGRRRPGSCGVKIYARRHVDSKRDVKTTLNRMQQKRESSYRFIM